MADFIYQEPFPVGEDKTKYRLLTKEYVKVVECDGRKILKVDPKGLELLSKEAYADVSFYLRAAHLQKLRNILEDPEATDNDKFVAYTMLLNQTVSAEGELPTCQDTGTAICIGHKGEDVWTGADDAECIARGVYETYKDRNLRYSQVVPFTMTDEKNSGTNLPAQIDIYGGKPGMEYEFLFITKGGGSANKTFLYQQTKALLNEESLTKFIQQHIFDLGTSACPPYHLAICIGGTSAEMCLSTVKKASAGYLDELPTSGNEGGRCFRDLEWEEKVLKICRESGVGAQFGGKYLVHDVRVIRAPRHAASCPVAIGVSCSADRNIKAKITPEGIFLEELEKNPARFLPTEAPSMSPAVDIDLDEGMDKVREILFVKPVRRHDPAMDRQIDRVLRLRNRLLRERRLRRRIAAVKPDVAVRNRTRRLLESEIQVRFLHILRDHGARAGAVPVLRPAIGLPAGVEVRILLFPFALEHQHEFHAVPAVHRPGDAGELQIALSVKIPAGRADLLDVDRNDHRNRVPVRHLVGRDRHGQDGSPFEILLDLRERTLVDRRPDVRIVKIHRVEQFRLRRPQRQHGQCRRPHHPSSPFFQDTPPCLVEHIRRSR